MTVARKEHKETTKDMSGEEKELLKQNKKKEKKRKQKEINEKKKEEYNKLSKEEKKLLRETKKTKTNVEFPYIDELSDEELNLINQNVGYCDPGKRDLLTIMDDDGNVFTYSNKQRLHDTKRLKYQKLLENHRKETGITKIENELSEYNSKTCTFDDFKEYILHKNAINNLLFKIFYNEKFRQYKWYSYINKERSESKLLDTIENTFNKDRDTKFNIVMGDWSIGKQLRNFISTPMISLKRKLAERFGVYNIDEYNTSHLHYNTENECANLYYTDKTNKLRKLHSVLTYKMENNRKGCINRDVNAVKNMRKLFKHWLIYKKWAEKYSRNKSKQPADLSSSSSNAQHAH